jgi:hypothetical protein
MKMVCDEIDLDIIEYVLKNPGCTYRDCYSGLIGKPRKETFLYTRARLLIAEGYLERRSISPGRRRIFPGRKAKKVVIDDW